MEKVINSVRIPVSTLRTGGDPSCHSVAVGLLSMVERLPTSFYVH